MIEEMVEFYLPLLATAGDYALAIQPRIGGPAPKSGHNAWVSALTDADLSVQNFLEVATLSRYPQVSFYGEEHASSMNQRYFPKDAPISVHVDPVNGTFLYKNQRPGWDIIVSIAEQRRLMAAISYMPPTGRYHLAIRGRGAFAADRRQPDLAHCQPLRTATGSRNCLTYQAPDVNERLAGAFACFDFVKDDDPARRLDNLNELYSGRLAAFACRGGECLDWGAAAFLAVTAGGVATHLDGSPLGIFEHFDPEMKVDMVVATDPATHAAIIARLRSADLA